MKDLNQPFLLFSILTGMIEAVLAYLVNGIYSGSLILSLLFENNAVGTIIFWVIVKFLLVLAGSFILSGIFHLTLKLLNGQGGYEDTYKVFAYSLIPLFLIGLIPWVGPLGLLYTLVLLIKGCQSFITFLD